MPFCGYTWVGTFRNNWEQETKKKKEAYNTCCSQAVTHPSTEQARHCLTSVIRRELVYSVWYGCRHRLPLKNAILWIYLGRNSPKQLGARNKNKRQQKLLGLEKEKLKLKLLMDRKKKKKKPTTPAVPRRSPIQVLSRPDTA